MRPLVVSTSLLVLITLAPPIFAEEPWMMPPGVRSDVRLLEVSPRRLINLGLGYGPSGNPKPPSERTTEYVNGVSVEPQTYQGRLAEISPRFLPSLGTDFVELPAVETHEEFVNGVQTNEKWNWGKLPAASLGPTE